VPAEKWADAYAGCALHLHARYRYDGQESTYSVRPATFDRVCKLVLKAAHAEGL
jgi:hypothetical protein